MLGTQNSGFTTWTRRPQPFYQSAVPPRVAVLYAFDVLSIEGKDVRALPLLERKRRLRACQPRVESRLLYLDHIAERGCDLFRVACERDLEGIVGKWARGTYQIDTRRTSWLKIKNPGYTQIQDRHELFEVRHAAQRIRLHPRPKLHLG
jgi:ATP-dependent DNA ligase